jgi:hypothetical protein
MSREKKDEGKEKNEGNKEKRKKCINYFQN